MINRFLTVCMCVAVLTATLPAQSAEEKILNVYNWADYVLPEIILEFEDEFGIRVNYDTYDTSAFVDAKLLAGGSGYDVVLHDTQLIARLLPIGLFLPLDRAKLPNWANLDDDLLEAMEAHDPGNLYATPYMWGSVGWSYNVDMVRERVPNADVESAAFIFEPEILSKLQDCGVSYLSTPSDLIPMALAYLGYDINTVDPAAMEDVEALLLRARPYIKYFDSSRMIQDLPAREVCVAMGWSGDYAQAWDRAKEAGIDIELAYAVPKQGSALWIDGLVIPADAPHPDNAHLFLNYLMRPDVIARLSNSLYTANGNEASVPFLIDEVYKNASIYPPDTIRSILFTKKPLSPKDERRRTRLWARVTSGL